MTTNKGRKKTVKLVCYKCGKQDETVYERICAYQKEINGIEHLETICDDCEQQHRDDI